MIESWQALVAIIITGFGTLFVAVFSGLRKLVLAWFDHQAKKISATRFVEGVERVAKFHQILEMFRNMKFADRVLLFRGTNCGGTPDPNRPYTVQCFYGWSRDPLKHPEENYSFPIQVDHHYMAMLLDVIREGHSFQRSDRMPPDARLKAYYENEGVKTSALYFLNIDQNALLFISVASYAADEFTHPQLTELSLVIDRARSCLSDQGTAERPALKWKD
ncbi:hypothetical protein [Zavarzinella formosa]|uniref:hypothetical protein n=1 Tax=Zavarzinella formosa TaxID=360055 RepID=UPI000365BE07|nr:hypothetical protein [Zavarzinella formosa]